MEIENKRENEEIDQNLYDLQRLHGIESQKKISKSKILLVGLKGLGIEIDNAVWYILCGDSGSQSFLEKFFF